nr:hypothetical protein [Tanacetum cinerariifolium]
TGAPQGEELGLIKPLSDSSFSCFDKSFILEGATPPPSPIRSLGYRAAMIRLRDEAASTSHSPPLQLPSASRREDKPEVTLPPQKRLDIALGLRYEVGESSSAAAARPAGGFRADYGFVATVDREIMRDPEREIGYKITDSRDERPLACRQCLKGKRDHCFTYNDLGGV